MLVENTREEALKAFLNGSDVRMAVDTGNGPMAFLHLKDLIPLGAIYFINVEIEPEDDYEEKVFSSGRDESEKAPIAEKDGKPKRKTAKDIIRPYVEQGLSDSEIAAKTGMKYGTVYAAAKNLRKLKESTKGRNADRHLCKTCQYRATSYNEKNCKIRCEYALKSNPRHSRGCDVEDCDKYVMGRPLMAKEGIED